MIEKIKALFESRRFWAALVVAILNVVGSYLGIEQETLTRITAVVAAWIIGDSMSKTVRADESRYRSAA